MSWECVIKTVKPHIAWSVCPTGQSALDRPRCSQSLRLNRWLQTCGGVLLLCKLIGHYLQKKSTTQFQRKLAGWLDKKCNNKQGTTHGEIKLLHYNREKVWLCFLKVWLNYASQASTLIVNQNIQDSDRASNSCQRRPVQVLLSSGRKLLSGPGSRGESLGAPLDTTPITSKHDWYGRSIVHTVQHGLIGTQTGSRLHRPALRLLDKRRRLT